MYPTNMNHIATALLLLLALALPAHAADLILKDAPAQVYFSPKGGGQDAIVQTIGKAKSTILVQAYSFTSAPIAEALKKAHDRGVKVQAILDKSQRGEKYTGATYLKNAGIPVAIDVAHAIAHNKVMVLDDDVVVTGSFNFTKAAEERNAENVLIVEDKGLARLYRENWEAHRGHSEDY
jgi:phosphatidylserine/phosphatidylglycerophosphate/cardiolipin synthase-like enzyme